MSLTPSRRALSVVIPAYNEAGNLERAVQDVVRVVQDFDDYEILIVNDGSSDTTGQLADRLAREMPRVSAIHHPHNRGFAAAYRTGLAAAGMDYFTFVPGDNEIRPESVQQIFDAIGVADLVVPYHGNPEARTWPRRLLTWASTTEINLLFGWRLHYFQGPTVYPTALARALPATVPGFFFATEMLVHALAAGCTYVQVPLSHQERAYGRSKAVGLSKIIQAELAILQLWWKIRVKQFRAVPGNLRNPSGKLAEGTKP